jgi:virulence-associated protein VagC
MAIRKVFRGGNRNAVQSPRNPRVRVERVEITKRADEIGQRERRENLSAAFEHLTSFSSDFFKGGRRQPKLEKRSGFDELPPRHQPL